MMPIILGFAGLLPALACLVAIVLGGSELRYTALAAGFGYAALIFSFLGGLWWGLASAPSSASRSPVRPWIYIAAVLPSLIAFVLYLPWVFGHDWPGPSLIWLGVGILASPLVDRQLARAGLTPPWWMRLRWALSSGLGLATLALGIAALM